MKFDKKTLLLYAVTDRTWLGEQTLYEQVMLTLNGGATCIQLREKELDDGNFLKEALEIKDLCKEFNVPFIINDNVDIAIKCGADGVHIGQSDMKAYDVRNKIGNDMILGVSVQTLEEAVSAKKSGADYLGVGAIFSTSTKVDASCVTREQLIEITSKVDVPVVAIGGIYKHNLLELAGTNVYGVALISAIFASKDVLNETKSLKKLSKEMVEK